MPMMTSSNNPLKPSHPSWGNPPVPPSGLGTSLPPSWSGTSLLPSSPGTSGPPSGPGTSVPLSWPGVSGPSRASDTRKRFQCLARGASLAGDSPHEAGYDRDEAGHDRDEAGYDSDRDEAGHDSDIAMLAPLGMSGPPTHRPWPPSWRAPCPPPTPVLASQPGNRRRPPTRLTSPQVGRSPPK